MHDEKILVDVERMRYPNTGLYYYCLHLANALQQQQALHKGTPWILPSKRNDVVVPQQRTEPRSAFFP
jgi:hypothetical protein